MFFGGKGYLSLFALLTSSIRAPKTVFYNSDDVPKMPCCMLKRVETRTRHQLARPVHKALHRTLTVWGVDRRLFFLALPMVAQCSQFGVALSCQLSAVKIAFPPFCPSCLPAFLPFFLPLSRY